MCWRRVLRNAYKEACLVESKGERVRENVSVCKRVERKRELQWQQPCCHCSSYKSTKGSRVE